MKRINDEISDEELRSITDAIKTKYGIDFTNYELKSLKRGFGRLISKNNFTSLLELWSNILRSKEFVLGCIDELTVNLTEMFRNPEIWKQIQEVAVERYSQRKPIKMWHAGCSTGEEIYTTAIVMNQIKYLNNIKTLATDLSPLALERAKKAEYSYILENKYISSLKIFDKSAHFNDFFEREKDGFVLKQFLKNHITFKAHNLVTDGMVQKFDIIFCRNVMIYFDDVLKMKVLNLLHESLNEDGILIIGFYDAMPFESKDLFVSINSKAKIYEKINEKSLSKKEGAVNRIVDDSARARLQSYLADKKK